MNSKKACFWAAGALALGASGAALAGQLSAQEKAIKLFDRLAGTPIALSDPRLQQMTSRLEAGDALGAAEVALEDDGFVNIVARHFFTHLSTRDEDPLAPLTDFVATGAGVARDDRDARELLTGNAIYKANASVNDPAAAADPTKDIQNDTAIYKSNAHYDYLDRTAANLRQVLERAPLKVMAAGANNANPADTDAPIDHPDPAGLLSTRAWAEAHFNMGTNRRAVEFAFREFLCLPITGWADASAPDDRVRRDVDRAPGGNTKIYLTSCRGCHTGMDGFGGAFAYIDYRGDSSRRFPVFAPGVVQSKLNVNNGVFAGGFITQDNSWVNNARFNQNAQTLGWAEGAPINGRGMHELGELLANSKRFPYCMAKRAFKEVCKREATDSEEALLDSLAQDFKANGYKLKRLFKKAAVLPACLGQ